MIVNQFVKFVFSIALLPLNYSIATENTLETAVAKLMKVEPKQIGLKNETKGMTSARNYLFELNEKKYIVKIFGKKHSTDY